VKLLLAVILLVASVAGLPAASATSSFVPNPSEVFFANGTILSVAAAPGQIYVGGDFTLIGRPTGSWVAIGPDGKPVAGRPQVAGFVSAATPDGRNGWFVAGTIRGVGARERSAAVVHLRANGELDESWRVAVRGGRVAALALRGRMLFLGGDFKTVGGKVRHGLAAVGSTRGRLLGWRLQGDPRVIQKGQRAGAGSISALAVSRDRRALYLSGYFNRIGSVQRAGLAAVAVGSGRVTRWNPAPTGSVEVIRPAPRSRVVFVGGDFTRIGGASRNAVAAVDATTARSLPFNAHASRYASVSDVIVTATTVYVAGDFSSLGGKSRHLLAALDARTGAVTPWEPSVSGDDVTALALDASRSTIYLAGDLTEVGGQQRDALGAVDIRTGAATPWDPRALGDIAILSAGAQGSVFAGGDIAFVGGARRHGLASFAAGGSLTDWDPAIQGIVRALAIRPDNSRLYVGGAFAPGDAPAQRNLAVVDLSTGALRAFGGGTNSGVWAMAPSADGSTLYIGGAFVTVAGKRRTRLAALDAGTGELLSWNSGANDLVRVLLPTAEALYVGGDFVSAGGLSRPRLVKLDTGTGAALGWSPDPDDNVWALELRDETLYVGGEFGQIGGRTRNALAAVDVESGDASSWDPNADETVRVLRLSPDHGRLFAAGEFEKIGNATRGYAEFSLPQGSLTGWSPLAAFDGYALAFAQGGSLLVIGGRGGVDVFG
jgi:hypothetical protein